MSYHSEQSMEQSRTVNHTRNILRNVYIWMTIALLITAMTALIFAKTGLTSLMSEAGLLLVIPIATLVLVFVLALLIQKMHPIVAIITFVVYAFLIGVSLSSVFYIFELGSIFQAFFGTAAMFGAMSLYGYFTKRDLNSWGTYLHMALIGLVLTNLITFFIGGLNQGVFNYIVSSIGVLVFVGLTAYDTQKIKKVSEQFGDSIQEADYIRLSIQGALSLYLDFINIFLYLLRLIGARR